MTPTFLLHGNGCDQIVFLFFFKLSFQEKAVPYRLINKLQKLMTMEFQSSPDTDLGSSAAGLPADVYDVVDEIADAAREIFGPALRPNPRQDFLMQDACFPVKAGEVQLTCWRSGRIHTPRGIVTYY